MGESLAAGGGSALDNFTSLYILGPPGGTAAVQALDPWPPSFSSPLGGEVSMRR